MSQTLDFDKLYTDVLDKAAGYFSHSAQTLKDLPSDKQEAIKNYLKSDAAKHNSELKRLVIAALQDGLHRVPHNENNYETGAAASLLYISGALGSHAFISAAAETGQDFAGSAEIKKRYTNAVVSDFARFKKIFDGAQLAPEIYYKDKVNDYSRIRPLCSGIDVVLKDVSKQLKRRIVVDNMLNKANDEKSIERVAKQIAENPGGVKIIALALTPDQALKLPGANERNPQEVRDSAIGFAQNFQNHLSKLNIDITLLDRNGKTIYYRDREHPGDKPIEELAEWYKGCGIMPEVKFGDGSTSISPPRT